ncbi:hypothetical protein [Brevundimonas sp.]|uniref:hypothetical protein n=1 Tax=Brevundimonas sp. TaxID=1871086 RepID=UPI0025C1D0D6|nr:hypothetical protein [Brevundimonas sp.]
MSDLSQPRRPTFAVVVVGSYVLAAATAVIVSAAWIEEMLWIGGAVFLAWLAMIGWAFSRFGGRAAWMLLGFLFVNPVTLFFGGLTYACAVKAACL